MGASRAIASIAACAIAWAAAPVTDARADEAAFVGPPELTRARPMSRHLLDAVDELAAAVDAHLGVLTGDVVGLSIDGRHRRGRVRLGGDTAIAGVRFVGDVRWHRGGAHVRARIALRLGGTRLQLDVPAFELRPTRVAGERGVEIRVPLVSGTF